MLYSLDLMLFNKIRQSSQNYCNLLSFYVVQRQFWELTELELQVSQVTEVMKFLALLVDGGQVLCHKLEIFSFLAEHTFLGFWQSSAFSYSFYQAFIHYPQQLHNLDYNEYLTQSTTSSKVFPLSSAFCILFQVQVRLLLRILANV